MTLLPLLLLFEAVLGLQNPAIQYYKDLNCTSIQKSGSPTIYNCDHLDELETERCYYNGKMYSHGDVIRPDVIQNPCIAECNCAKEYGSERASFRCAHIECPRLFTPLEPGCVDIHEKGKCCAVRQHCDSSHELPTCKYDGKVYKLGEVFYPSDESCVKCTCMEGFNGTLSEQFCERITCELYLHYFNKIRDGCVPTYYKPTDCCPIPEWRCPSSTDSVVKPQAAEVKLHDNLCKFGNLELQVGQVLSKSEDHRCINCSCQVPPHITCVMNTTCYESW